MDMNGQGSNVIRASAHRGAIGPLLIAILVAIPGQAMAATGEAAGTSAHFQPPVKAGTTAMVSLTSAGTQPKGESGTCGSKTGDHYAINDDGRYVAFVSNADALTPDDSNGSIIQDVFVKDLETGRTELVSGNSLGEVPTQIEGIALSVCTPAIIKGVAISGNGRFVAFSSLIPVTRDDERPLQWDVFLRDRKKGTTKMISVASDGTQANGDSGTEGISLSDDGKLIAFSSTAGNLDGNVAACIDALVASVCGRTQVYVHQRLSGMTTLVSRDAAGSASAGDAAHPSLSGNGRFVAFDAAGSLVPEDLNACPWKNPSLPSCPDVYLYDLKTKTPELVSVNLLGVAGNEASTLNTQLNVGQVSDDGRFVSFFSQVTNLVPAQFALDGGVFLRDRERRRTDRLDVTSSGTATIGQLASMSDDGRFSIAYTQNGFEVGSEPMLRLHDRVTGQTDIVMASWHQTDWWPAMDGRGQAFVWPSADEDLVTGDTNDDFDMFIRDWGWTKLGVGGLSAGPGNALLIPENASMSRTADVADRTADVPVVYRGADLAGGTLVHRPALEDLYLRIDVAEMGPLSGVAPDPFVFGARFSVEGTRYEVRAQRSVAGLLSPQGAELGLFRCDVTCERVADLAGGYGTTGESIVVSIPVGEIGLTAGGKLEDLQIFSAVGSYAQGAISLIDTAKI